MSQMTQHHSLCALMARTHRHLSILAGLATGLLVSAAGNAAGEAAPGSTASDRSDAAEPSEPTNAARVLLSVGKRHFTLTLADTEAARAFANQLPMTLDMPDLNGNEKHTKLPGPLPVNAIRPGTIRSGDLMLYGSDTLVVFYLTFDSAYSYTRLGRMDDSVGLAQALGKGSARITFSLP